MTINKLLLSGSSLNPLSEFYVAAISKLGIDCTISNPNNDLPNPLEYDALLLCGGLDVNPVRYGCHEVHPTTEIDVLRDDREFKLFAEFMYHSKPVFGICRGCQLINVGFGGTLWQDLPSQHGISHANPRDVEMLTHCVTWSDGSVQTVNSAHHQAIKTLGEGLVAVAKSEDGLIEAIRHEKLPVAAVQWHPERMEQNLEFLFNMVIT